MDNWKPVHSILLFALSVAIVLVARLMDPTPRGWFAVILLMIVFMVATGHGVTGVYRGAWIDGRNKISLSQFQIIIWTVLILSAYLMAAFWNLGRVPAGTSALSALQIRIPVEVWALMGIGVTSFAASPMIKSNKAKKKGTVTLKEGPRAERAEGVLVLNENNREASWGDLFTGEEIGNHAQFDVGKAQMFFFTLVIAFAYGRALYGTLYAAVAEPSGLVQAFPDISDSMVMLLGISHTGYLTYKAVPHTPTVEPGD